ncbi:peptidase T [Bradyrhizobium sp. G127]|uniref:peptidase T n=1 Tax=Bradyrhizobium sp. G127 TaxID=2904800 RepID=UPI001F2A7714|nr:peptidase T [Bradyrhizobium sp. G127]MCF2523826.1 peptidase T [Bradyrhizobium sp. G127]
MSPNFTHTVLDRFLRYVRIDTQSDASSPTCPSTEKQKDLGRLLAQELRDLGLKDAHMDEHGYVYGTLPANTGKTVPVICFCSHMDTSPDCTGKDVKPQIVRNYRGGDIMLPADPKQIIRAAEHPALAEQIGNDIVTTDGTTLLGADNKAGVAEIMDAVQVLLANPQIRHGTIKILFTPDEEIGRGADKVDLTKLGAAFGYTIDGESVGHLEDETFSADGVTITIQGVSAHPGFAKGKMEHALKIAARIVDRLPQDMTPETTEGREGFLHPVGLEGGLDSATLSLIVRDFTEQGLKEKEGLLEDLVRAVMKDFPRSSYRIEVKQQYRNMKEVLDRHPEVVENALEAIGRAGVQPVLSSIRGGTDGSRLSFMGLPCPNIFAGEHAFHSRLEWVSVQDMEAAVRTIVHLAALWEEKA